MKTQTKKITLFFSIAFLSLVVIGIIIFSQSEEMKFKSCPYGHFSLKNVPIEYGYIIPGPNYSKAIDNYEFYPGGCEIFPDAPKYKIICTKCGYVLENDSTNYWKRTKKENKGFEIPLDKIISNFPIKNLIMIYDETSLSYTQEYMGGKIVKEAINYDSRSELEDLEIFLIDYSKICSLNFNKIDLSKNMFYENYKSVKAYRSITDNKIFELIMCETNNYDPIKITFSWSL